MLIQKFGGSSLAGLDGFVAAAGIISNAARDEKVVVVLSAMYGVTDLLESAVKAAIAGDDFKTVLASINNKEQGILQEMQSSGWNRSPLPSTTRSPAYFFSLPRNSHLLGPL